MTSAHILTVGDLFTPPTRFVVPPGYRRYGWGQDEWTRLWRDIQTTAEQPGGRHFLGTLVVRPDPEPGADPEPAADPGPGADPEPGPDPGPGAFVEPAGLLVVDGQQRLMTLQVFLHVLQVLGDARGVPDVTARARVLTVNPGARTAAQRLKVVPGPADYDSFVDAVVGLDPVVNPQRPTDHPFSEFGHAFASLVGRYLNSTPDAAAALTTILDTVRDRLFVVLLTLGEDEDPQTVHDRLNPTVTAAAD